jgi:hypothetical protein
MEFRADTFRTRPSNRRRTRTTRTTTARAVPKETGILSRVLSIFLFIGAVLYYCLAFVCELAADVFGRSPKDED